MALEIQTHLLGEGRGSVEISRDGNHSYKVNGGAKLQNVTSYLGHLDADGFGMGSGWVQKVIKESGGDVDAVASASRASRDEGSALHDEIHQWITREQQVNEDSPMFISWLHMADQLFDDEGMTFVASERFVYHPELGYAGTVDAIGASDREPGFAIFDWKTRDYDQFQKRGPYLKDMVQVGAYAHALYSMRSIYGEILPKGYVVYLFRGDTVRMPYIKEVNIENSMQLFVAARALHNLVIEAKI